MAKPLDQFRRRKKALEVLEGLFKSPEHVLVIHYSCESFYETQDGRTPRVTSIAVRNLGTGQTRSYSIHKVAEQEHVSVAEIATRYDRLERGMLGEFFEFVGQNRHATWVHWNMRDINYGFQAIEHRFQVLGGTPVEIADAKKFDLARQLIAIYGNKYVGHPRLESLINVNGISHRDFLVGKAEAEAFENKEFVKLHQSTLRKVDILANIAGRVDNGSLVTQSKFSDRTGLHPAVLMEYLREHWVYSTLGAIALVGGILRIVGVI